MEQTDWLNDGFDAAQARFLMVTAITHHRFSSPVWGELEVRKLHRELAEIEASAALVGAPRPARWHRIGPGFRIRFRNWPGIRGAGTRRSRERTATPGLEWPGTGGRR
jgi:hypothetical protein